LLRLSQKYPSKRAFITGAAGGLGLAFALELASDGWKIAMADLSLEKLQEASAKVAAAGATVEIYCFDVSDYGQFKLAVESFEDFYNFQPPPETVIEASENYESY